MGRRVMIDLNQAEILCKRMKPEPGKKLYDVDWKEILAAQHEALKMFPQLVSELQVARDYIGTLENDILRMEGDV